MEIKFFDNTESAHTLLVYIFDNNCYWVKDSKIIQIVFALVEAKIKTESLVLTPNMIRFWASRLINNDQTLIVKINNVVVSSNNRARLFTRLARSAINCIFRGFICNTPGCSLDVVVIFWCQRKLYL